MSARLPQAASCLRRCAPITPATGSDASADMATLHNWAMGQSANEGITGSQIEVASFCCVSPSAKPAFDRLHDAMLAMLPEPITQRRQEQHLQLFPELLFCRWAAPHTDNMFNGELFLSLVLGTGPSEYRVESLVPTIEPAPQDARRSPRLNFQRQSMTLRTGLVFLLDPLVPHYACPETPHQDNLLTLLQLRLPYRNRRERQQWIRMLTPQRLQ